MAGPPHNISWDSLSIPVDRTALGLDGPPQVIEQEADKVCGQSLRTVVFFLDLILKGLLVCSEYGF
jgi:hypothetical protein